MCGCLSVPDLLWKMTSNEKVLKCINCNLVVNELLTFVQNKHDVMDNESLVRICSTAFTMEDIEKAKSLLFQSVTTDLRQIRRKNKDGKSNKDLFDIIEVFKATDPEIIPIFVARDLNQLPPVTFDHVDCTKLLKDIVLLQNELKAIKSTYVTVDQLTQAKEEITNFITQGGSSARANITVPGRSDVNTMIGNHTNRNINLRRGACLTSFSFDSGPMGMPHLPVENISTSTVNNVPTISSCECVNTGASEYNFTPVSAPTSGMSPRRQRVEAPQLDTEVSAAARRAGGAGRAECNVSSDGSDVRPTVVSNGSCSGLEALPTLTDSTPAMPTSNSCSHTKSFADIARSAGKWKQPVLSDEWKEVQRNRYKNRFIGRKGVAVPSAECKFRAADIRLPLFINNVDKAASPADIAHYIKEKTQVCVSLERVIMKQNKDYDAYKMFVPRHKLTLFMDDKIWPEGISFRRFIDFERRRITVKNQNECQSDSVQ